jgi:pimeloyl-ACP methyl ester carboxylesterase
MSDRVSGAPTLEQRMDDVRAVMDAVGSRRAAFYGLSEGAAMGILFAATYPDRMAALVIRSAYPRRMWAPDYPWGQTEEAYEREVERNLQVFGPREQGREAVRSLGRFSDEEVDHFLQMLRFGTSPGSLSALHRMNKEIDVRHVLPSVRVPTLVLHGSEDQIVPLEVAQYLASTIPTARLVELPGVGHLAFGDPASDVIVGQIEAFTKGVWEAGGWEEPEPDRVLATVLFTDMSARPRGPPSSEIAPGGSCSNSITGSSAASSFAIAALSSTWPATASSRVSTAQREPFVRLRDHRVGSRDGARDSRRAAHRGM